jgi:hydroxysqualene synthase
VGVEKGLRLGLQGLLARLLAFALPEAQARLCRCVLRFLARLGLAGLAQIDGIGQFAFSVPCLHSRAQLWQQGLVTVQKPACLTARPGVGTPPKDRKEAVMVQLEERPGAAPLAPEAPSGKGAGDENFPVGSFLLKPALRPHVAAYYAFARAGDDIADDGALAPAEKIARLDGFAAALRGEAGFGQGYGKAHRLRESLLARGISLERGLDLLRAFRQDSEKSRYANFEELEAYCALSANPVGRFLIDLHGESPALYEASDSLCSALQVLNHIQDCAKDLQALDRVYVPQDWLHLHGARIEDLRRDALTAPLRTVIDRMLARCAAWITKAQPLARGMKDRRFAWEAHMIVALAARLCALLRAQDMLAKRVALSKLDFAAAALAGWKVAMFERAPGPR